MKACIYARTAHNDKSHNRTALQTQIDVARAIAHGRNLTVDYAHVFTDTDAAGDSPPTPWKRDENQPARPALTALVEAVEAGAVQWVLVHRLDRLATSSELLIALRDFFLHYRVRIAVSPDQAADSQDPTETFALSILQPCIATDLLADRTRKELQRSRKQGEIDRLKARLLRLETELDALSEDT